MKILQVSHGFPPDQSAGAENYTYHVCAGLRALGEDVVVLAPGQRERAAEYEVVEESVDGLRVLRLNNRYRGLFDLTSTYANPALDDVFDQVLAAERPDVVHVQHTVGTTSNTIPRARARGIPVVVTLHDFWFHCARGQRLTPGGHLCAEVEPWRCALCIGKKRAKYAYNHAVGSLRGDTPESAGEGSLVRGLKLLPRLAAYAVREGGARPIRRRLEHMGKVLEQADLLLAPSRFLLEQFRLQGVPADKLLFSEYGMSRAPFAGTSREPTTDAGRVRFGFVGTLIHSKGPDLLVEAFQDVPRGVARLEFHGPPAAPDGERFAASLRRRNQHPDLSFCGPFPPADVARILSRLDVLVVPSRWYENAPLTLHESVLAGIASITTDHGGMREFAERFGTALTFTPDDVGSLRRTLQRFLDEPELASKLSRPRREVRTVEDDVRALVGHYRRLAGPRPS